MSWVISLSIDTLFQTCAHQNLRTAILFCYHVPILSLLTLPAAWMFVYSQLLPLVFQLLFSPLSTKWFFSYSFTHFTLLLWRRYVGMIFDTSHAHTYRKFISLATGKQIFLYVCVCVWVYLLYKAVSQVIIGTFFSVPSSKDDRMGRFRGFFSLFVEV